MRTIEITNNSLLAKYIKCLLESKSLIDFAVKTNELFETYNGVQCVRIVERVINLIEFGTSSKWLTIGQMEKVIFDSSEKINNMVVFVDRE